MEFASVTLAMGLLFCREPKFPPACLDYPASFSDTYAFDRCRFDVQGYFDEMQKYGACLMTERNEALKKAKDAIERFNCMAKWARYCP